MATKKTPLTEDDALMPVGNEAELDQAIDDLRGVLKADSDGDVPGFDADFGASATTDFAQPSGFGGEFGADTDSFGGGSDFGGSSFDDDAMSSGGSQREAGSALDANLDLIMDIPIDLEIVLGTSRMQV
jgi:flagellar motor switch protein FliN/FliY